MTKVSETRNPAAVHDERFVPALFAQWGPVVTAAPESHLVSACSTPPARPGP